MLWNLTSTSAALSAASISAAAMAMRVLSDGSSLLFTEWQQTTGYWGAGMIAGAAQI
jgi:hypothetical protein